jgi:hypothetical protein
MLSQEYPILLDNTIKPLLKCTMRFLLPPFINGFMIFTRQKSIISFQIVSLAKNAAETIIQLFQRTIVIF